MTLFSIEIILSVLCKKNYFLSFFFWLDILSTITLVFDLGWVNKHFSKTNAFNFIIFLNKFNFRDIKIKKK